MKSLVATVKAKATSANAMTSEKSVSGAFWYTPLLSTGSCSGDPMGQPNGYKASLDTIEVALLVNTADVGSTVTISSGGTQIAKYTLVNAGLNARSITGVKSGIQKVTVTSAVGTVIANQSGTLQVQQTLANGLCNYNMAVVALP